jgi:hypothetical protein
MKKLITPALLGALALLASTVTAASAQEPAAEKPVTPTVLKKYDLNKDGKLDETERAAWIADKKAQAAKKNKKKADAEMKPETVK